MDAGRNHVSGPGRDHVSDPDYRPEFLAALDLLAKACAIVQAKGGVLPVLVGGAVVEIETTSAITTGDFDLLGGTEAMMEEALAEVGFTRESRPGRKLGGFFHADLPIGIEFVSGGYFDGRGDRQRIRLLDRPAGPIPLAAVEDLIADRMGQWEASDRRDQARLSQAVLLLELAMDIDDAYLDRRIIEETAGAADLATLRSHRP